MAPEWGWIILGEIARYGTGVDTAPEAWLLIGDGASLVSATRAYWATHPELADGDYERPA